VTGEICQRWDSQSPNTHEYTDPAQFPDDTLADASNYCRNPTNMAYGMWCVVVSYYWYIDFCDVPLCAADYCKYRNICVLLDMTISN
jgi:hypothetical protein